MCCAVEHGVVYCAKCYTAIETLTNGTSVRIVGITSTTPFLVPTLELNVANTAICLGNIYQGLLGCDLLCRHNEVLGAATITLPWLN